MTSLLGRLLPLFTGATRVEDLFTEAVARLFERCPGLCLAWLDEAGLISPAGDGEQRRVHVNTQESFVRLEDHGLGSRPDMVLKVHRAPGDEEMEGSTEIVMIESKIGSWEGADQLKRYAGHLQGMYGDRKTLVYITRNYDPKEPDSILSGHDSVRFEQRRWHDFYKFLQTIEKDALTEEVMAFMEEQGMSRRHRFSTSDLMALSGVPRAFEIFDETLGDEVKAELEAFAVKKIMRRAVENDMRGLNRYLLRAPLHPQQQIFCAVGYNMFTPETFPELRVALVAPPNSEDRKLFVPVMRKISFKEGWEAYNLGQHTEGAVVSRELSLASLLAEEDHVAAVKGFFIESIGQLREELTEFKKENPELPWNGGEPG